MNNQLLVERTEKRGRRTNKNSLSKYKIPLLLSSGSRHNYTLSTADEGTLAFRGPQDIKCLIRHLAGVGDDEVDVDLDSDNNNGGTGCNIVDGVGRKQKIAEQGGR